MSGALRIIRVSGIATIQDLGWRLGRATGLPAGGAVDPAALRIGNALVGNDDGAAGIELVLGRLTIEFTRPTRVALAGSAGPAVLGDDVIPSWRVELARPGRQLGVGPPAGGRFGYLAVEGGIDTPLTLGSRSTYLPTALGGWHGRRLSAGDELPLGSPGLLGPSVGFQFEPPVHSSDEPIRVTAGPQSHLFPDLSFERLAGDRYRVTPASDRMGTRLEGAPLEIRTKASLPSEATCLGALQVPDGGQPIAVLRDGPTVGGYPKIGAIVGADLARFSQVPLGDSVRFGWVSVAAAQQAARLAAESIRDILSAIRGR